MKISVAGTGFASFICIKYLVDLGIKPIVLDVGNKINEKNKIEIKSKSILKQKSFEKYLCLGGLSNIWAGVIDKYSENDFSKWPITKLELDPYYNEIIKLFDLAEIYSFYSKSNEDLLNYNIKKTNKLSHEKIYEDEHFLLKFSSLLTNKLTKNTEDSHLNTLIPFSIEESIKKLIQESKIEYRKEKIEKVSEINNQIIIETKTPLNEKKQTECDYLFLGCGAISTYSIIQNSYKNFDNSLKIKSSKKIVFPVRFKNIQNFEKKFFNTFPIFQLNTKGKDSYSIYSQISNFNPNVINYIFPKIENFKKYLILLKLLKNYGISYFSLGSNSSDEFTIDKYKNIKIYKKKFEFKKLISSCSQLFSKKFLNGQIYHINFPFKMKPLSGNHFGSVFPMTKNKKNFFESDRFGRIGSYKKISIIDSSIFSNLSSCPPTLTILANSLRISKEVKKADFFR